MTLWDFIPFIEDTYRVYRGIHDKCIFIGGDDDLEDCMTEEEYAYFYKLDESEKHHLNAEVNINNTYVLTFYSLSNLFSVDELETAIASFAQEKGIEIVLKQALVFGYNPLNLELLSNQNETELNVVDVYGNIDFDTLTINFFGFRS